MAKTFPFHYLEPHFASGLMDDPIVLLKRKTEGSLWMIDCGQNHHLAKRILKAVRILFVSHAHMDHLMGLDRLVRSQLVNGKSLLVYGPPGLAQRVFHKLQGYDWNLIEDYYCSLEVREIHLERGELHRYRLPGAEGFPLLEMGPVPLAGDIIHQEPEVTVRAISLDHKLTSMAYRFDEAQPFQPDPAKIEALGLTTGPWIHELKELFQQDRLQENLTLPGGEERRALGLYEEIRGKQRRLSIGVAMDMAESEENLRKLEDFFTGITLMSLECSYLKAHQDKATSTHHMSSLGFNRLARSIKPEFLIAQHHSKSYLRQPQTLYDELTPPEGCRLLRLPARITEEPMHLEELDRKLGLQRTNEEGQTGLRGQNSEHAGEREKQPKEEEIRCFIALRFGKECLDELQVALRRWIEAEPQAMLHARILPQENLHLTLAFLGRQPLRHLERIREELEKIQLEPIPLTFLKLEPFPGPQHPRVLAATLEPSPELAGLHKRVRLILKNLGIGEGESHKGQERDFRPHLSLIRFQGNARLRPEASIKLQTHHPLMALTLEESLLGPEGASYRPLLTIKPL